MACIAKRRNRYIIDFYDDQGKRQRKTLKRGTTKKRAKEILRDIEEQLEKGLYISDDRVPLFKNVMKDWLTQKKLNVRASYWSTCEGITRNHFKEFHNKKINRILTADVETWIANRQKEKMHILTLRKSLVILNQIMKYAVRHRYASYNPVIDAERPKNQGKIKEKKVRVLKPEDIKTFLDVVADPKYKMLFMLAIMSGARQGALLGLKWSDVDWENNQIHIQRTFNHQAWYDVKTGNSDRKVDLGPDTMGELKKWKLACPPNRLNLIFPNGMGQPINQSNMRTRHFFPALTKAKIGKIRFHDLRHTYASLLIEQGENPKYIQTQMGHSTPMITLNIYAHLLKPTNQESAIRLEKAIF